METTVEPARRRLRSAWRGLLWVLAGACAAWALGRLSGLTPPWPGAALLALTPWVVAGALLVALLAVVSRYRWPALVALVAALVVAGLVAPRAWGAAEHRSGPTLRVMTVNLRVGGADAATIVRLVRAGRVDLLALQEYTPAARDALRAAGLDAALPYRVADPEPLGIGSALYARAPLTGGTTPVGPGGFVQASATLRVAGAAPVAVRSAHPCAPYTAAHQDCWTRGLAGEPRAERHGTVRLLMGDFNATLDHPALRRLIGSGYRDAASVTGDALRPTWPADLVPAATLDHVLVDRRVGVASVAVRAVPDTDHRALLAVLTLPAG